MITHDIRTILQQHAVIDGTAVRLTCGQLDRKTYEQVNKALEHAGGKWKGGKVRAHLFESDPTETIQSIIATGELPKKNPLAFFATPADVVQEMLAIAGDLNGKNVLEPSAGVGAIADAARSVGARVQCIELDPKRAAILKANGHDVACADFLNYVPSTAFDAVLMNPPFSIDGDPLAYITHIERAWKLLAAHGILVAIAPSGFCFRNDKRCIAFRALVQQYGGYHSLDDGAFASSETEVNTVLLWMER